MNGLWRFDGEEKWNTHYLLKTARFIIHVKITHAIFFTRVIFQVALRWCFRTYFVWKNTLTITDIYTNLIAIFYRKFLYYDFYQFTSSSFVVFVQFCRSVYYVTFPLRYFYRGTEALYGHLFPLVFNAPTIFHGTCTRAGMGRGLGALFLRKANMKNARVPWQCLLSDMALDTGFADGYESRRRISPVSSCETLTENCRATILPAKGYNKYGAIVTITLLYQMQATRTGSRRRYYCNVGVSQCWLLLSRSVASRCEVKTRLCILYRFNKCRLKFNDLNVKRFAARDARDAAGCIRKICERRVW